MQAILRAMGMGMLLMGCLLVFPASAFSEEPTSPFGQSNVFSLNTNRIGFGDTAIMTITSVPDNALLPGATSLGNPMPNPFNPRITISFNVGRADHVDLNIYDLGGRLVKKLAAQKFEAGQYTRPWDGRNYKGSLMPAGVYLVRIQSGSITDTQKIILVK